jgi:hypothetical protein
MATKAKKTKKAPKKAAKKAAKKQPAKKAAPKKVEKPKQKRVVPIYSKVETVAQVDGEDIDLIMVKVEFLGESFKAATKKECAQFVKELRKKKAAEKAEEKAHNKELKIQAKREKIFPVVTAKIQKIANQIEKLSGALTLEEDHKKKLSVIANHLESIVEERDDSEEE